MKRKTEEYYNLIERIEDNFPEIDSDIYGRFAKD